jgi:DNA-binding LacI/PurR family transcriptional regulator
MQGVLSFLALRGLKTPDDVSLVCERYDPGLAWCRPKITHFQHEDDAALRILRRWMKGVIDNKPYTKQTSLPVEVVQGGSVGPAPCHPVRIKA